MCVVRAAGGRFSSFPRVALAAATVGREVLAAGSARSVVVHVALVLRQILVVVFVYVGLPTLHFCLHIWGGPLVYSGLKSTFVCLDWL